MEESDNDEEDFSFIPDEFAPKLKTAPKIRKKRNYK